MKNQKVFRILALVFAVAMMLTIASCDMLDKLLGKAPEHVHTEEVIPAVAPTCTSIGLTEGKKCTECGEILVAQETVAALGHTEVVVPAKEATCTTIGLTEGKKCSACDAVIVEQKVIDAKGHTEEVIAAVAATCTTTGLTEGKQCTVCEKITVAQQEVAALGHTWGEDVTEVEAPTCAIEGKGTVACTVCDATDEVAIPATGNHTWDNGVVTTLPSCAPGEKTYTCTVCGDEKFEAVQANGAHVYGEEFIIYPATCNADGLKGKTCANCNVTVKAGKIDALVGAEATHTFVEGKCSTCDTCEKHTYQSYIGSAKGDPVREDPDHPRFDFQWGICTDCGYVDANHEHFIKGGECYYCGDVYTQVTHRSIFDNDKDGFGDIYYFTKSLPERFRAEDAYFIDAKNDLLNLDKGNHSLYDQLRVDATVNEKTLPYAHAYCTKGENEELNYEITVEKSGTYEVAVYHRIKDTALRGATYIINEGTPAEYSFDTSYTWATQTDYENARNNQFLIGGYMIIEMNLAAGKNTIKITEAADCEKTQHFRAFFFALKEEKHVHAYTEEVVEATCGQAGSITYTCACGDTQTVVIPATGAHVNSETDKTCTVCNKELTLTVDQAIAIGLTLEKKASGNPDANQMTPCYYYVTVTLNNGDSGDTGFVRVKAENPEVTTLLALAGGYSDKVITNGTTMVVKAKIGHLNNAAKESEVRLYDITIAE